VSRIELRTRSIAAVSVPKSISLAGLQQIRAFRNALIGVARDDNNRRIVRFDLNATGRSVSSATTLDVPADLAGRGAVTIAGNDLLYLAPAAADTAEFVAYRIHLR
jgi:hypothetical protein